MKSVRLSRQNGFTIVELMVAMVISLILLAGVSQIFLSNRETYRVQSSLSRLQENARFAIDLLRSDISMAGFPNLDPFDLTKTGNTRLAIQREAATDCLGNASGGVATNVYALQDGNLTCNGVALIDNVQELSFMYGEDTDKDVEAERYVSTPGSNPIVSVRVTLTVVDPEFDFRRTFVTTIPLRNVR